MNEMANAPRPPAPRGATLAAAAGLVGLLGYVFLNALSRVHGHTGDFPAFYNASRAMLEGSDIYKTGFPDYIYPPLLAFLYLPFGLLTPPAAAVAMLVLLLVVFSAALWVGGRELAERFDVAPTWAALLPVLCLGLLLSEDKVRGEFQMWQTNSILLLLFCLALRWLDRRPTWAGAALALAFNIKYLPIAFLPYLLVRRRWAAAAAFVVGVPMFAALPAAYLGWETNAEYLATAYRGLFKLVGVEVGGADVALVQADLRVVLSLSVTSGIARLLGPDVPNSRSYLCALALALALGAWAWRLYRQAGVGFLYRPDGLAPGDPVVRRVAALEWAALLVCLLAFGPQSNSRHFSMLVLANCLAVVAVRYASGPTPRWPAAAGTAAFFLGSILPVGPLGGSEARRIWGEAGGISWCALAMLAGLTWFILKDARHLRKPRAEQGDLPDCSRRAA